VSEPVRAVGKPLRDPTTVSLVSHTEVVAVRVVPADRDRAFAAFVVPELIARWWGPTGWRTEVVAIDVQVGGKYSIRLCGPKGEVHLRRGEYLEVVPGRRLVRTLEFGEFPGLSVVETIEFVPARGGTRVTLSTRFPEVGASSDLTAAGIQNGVRSLFARLAQLFEPAPAVGS